MGLVEARDKSHLVARIACRFRADNGSIERWIEYDEVRQNDEPHVAWPTSTGRSDSTLDLKDKALVDRQGETLKAVPSHPLSLVHINHDSLQHQPRAT
jgi:hypothetical protein